MLCRSGRQDLRPETWPNHLHPAASSGDRAHSGAGSACGAALGPSWLACVAQAEGAARYRSGAVAGKGARAEPGGEGLAVHERAPKLTLYRDLYLRHGHS